MGRHPKTFTFADIRDDQLFQCPAPEALHYVSLLQRSAISSPTPRRFAGQRRELSESTLWNIGRRAPLITAYYKA